MMAVEERRRELRDIVKEELEAALTKLSREIVLTVTETLGQLGLLVKLEERRVGEEPVIKPALFRRLPFESHLFSTVSIATTEGKIDLLQQLQFPVMPELLIVVPTVETQIEFDRDISAKTPSVLADEPFSVALRVRVVHHKAVALTGTLKVFGFW